MPTPVVISNGQAVRVVSAPYAALREAVNEVTRALEDQTWTNLSSDERRGDAPYDERRATIERSRRAIRRYPLAKQAVKLLVNYVLGQGITLRANDKEHVARIVDEFWEDPVNRAVLTSHAAMGDALRSCFSDGGLYIVLFPDKEAGKLQLGLLDALYVEDIISDPENWRVAKWYKVRKPSGKYDFASGTWVPESSDEVVWYRDWHNTDEAPPEPEDKPEDKPKRRGRKARADHPLKVEDGLVYYVAINRRGLFGEPEPAAALDWLNEHRAFMEDRATINRAASSIAWRTKQKGTVASVAAEAARLRTTLSSTAGAWDRNPPPATASHLLENENSQTDWMRTDTGGAAALADERILRMMVGSSLGGIPNHIFGDEAAANLATATAMGTPLNKAMEQWQTLFGDMIQDLLTFLLETAHEAGRVGPRDDSVKYDDRSNKAQAAIDTVKDATPALPAGRQPAGLLGPGNGVGKPSWMAEHGSKDDPNYRKYHPDTAEPGAVVDEDRATAPQVPQDEEHTATVRRYMTDDGRWLPERTKLHDEYVNDVQWGVPTKGTPTVYMTGGAPAVGKSTLLLTPAFGMPQGGKAALVNADTAKLRLPEYEALVKDGFHGAAGVVHDEASHMAKRALYESLRNGHDVIYDVNANSGLEALRKKIDEMRAAGNGPTNIYADYVTVPFEVGMQRMVARAQHEGQQDYGRYIPESFMRAVYADIPRTVKGAIEANLFDRLRVWDNTVPKGSEPILLATYEPGKGLTVHQQKGWDTFMGGQQVKVRPETPVREHGDKGTPGYGRYHPGHGVSDAASLPPGVREQWREGERAYFEYHCLESDESGDAPAWYHSHQQVTVLGEAPSDAWEGSTYQERNEEGLSRMYRVRFDDGLEWDVFEDELLTGPQFYERPDPPRGGPLYVREHGDKDDPNYWRYHPGNDTNPIVEHDPQAPTRRLIFRFRTHLDDMTEADKRARIATVKRVVTRRFFGQNSAKRIDLEGTMAYVMLATDQFTMMPGTHEKGGVHYPPSVFGEARYYPPKGFREHGDKGRPDYYKYHPASGGGDVQTGAYADDVVEGARQLTREAAAAEPAVTRLLVGLAKDAGAEMGGLENRLKRQDSLESKIRKDMAKDGLTAAEAVAGINDHLRYTMVAARDRYAEMYEKAMAGLIAAGYHAVKPPKTFWSDGVGPDPIYKGVNAVFAGHGIRFELQFHTSESWAIKYRSHPLYKVLESPSAPPSAKDRAYAQMQALWVECPEPPNWPPPGRNRLRNFG
jgi:hypothetical protein